MSLSIAACADVLGLENPTLDDDGLDVGIGSGSGSGIGSGAGSGAGPDGGVQNPNGTIAFVQYGCNANWNTGSSLAAAYPSSQRGGNLAVIAVSWANPGTIKSVSDSAGNAWTQIAAPISGGGKSLALYYAPGVRDGANTVTVAFTATVAQSWLKALEYSGVAKTGSVDITTAQSGSSTTVSSGIAETTHPHDLIVGVATFGTDYTSMGYGYTERVRCYGDLVQDQEVTAAGAYTSSATLTQATGWTMRMVAFAGQ